MTLITLLIASSLSLAGGPAPPFLALPFPANPGMHINGGWYYDGGGLHRGIDYVLGTPHQSQSWQPFPVLASAPGAACWSRRGNGTWVTMRHTVGVVPYVTLYGHLASVSPRIPPCSSGETVALGSLEQLGVAGATGVGQGCAPLPADTCIHLHFGLQAPGGRYVDPYLIYAGPDAYPEPQIGPPGIGYFRAPPGD